MQYPAVFETDTDDGGYVVKFRDIPEAITQGDDDAEAMAMAEEVLISSIEFYLQNKRPIPSASKVRRGERLVPLPANISAKVLLLNEMLAQNVGTSELARRMGFEEAPTRRGNSSNDTKRAQRNFRPRRKRFPGKCIWTGDLDRGIRVFSKK